MDTEEDRRFCERSDRVLKRDEVAFQSRVEYLAKQIGVERAHRVRSVITHFDQEMKSLKEEFGFNDLRLEEIRGILYILENQT